MPRLKHLVCRTGWYYLRAIFGMDVDTRKLERQSVSLI